jgi:hypothetical protein
MLNFEALCNDGVAIERCAVPCSLVPGGKCTCSDTGHSGVLQLSVKTHFLSTSHYVLWNTDCSRTLDGSVNTSIVVKVMSGIVVHSSINVTEVAVAILSQTYLHIHTRL